MNKDIRQLLKRVAKQGAVIERTNDSHVRVCCPNGKVVVMSHTPSCDRAIRNARRDLRKIGGLAL